MAIVWIGGHLSWSPQITYRGGSRHVVPDIDVDRFSWFDLLGIYKELLGTGTNFDVYSSRPGFSLDSGLFTLKGDKDLMELVREYDGLPVIPIYFEEKPGPILALENQEVQPEDENQEVHHMQESGGGESSRIDVNDGEHVETPDDESDSSSDSSCPSWMLEDLEGPEDDDIFMSKPADHARKVMRQMRKYVRVEKKKKKQVEEANQRAANGNVDEEWYSDAENEDEPLHSDNEEWNESTNMASFELKVLQKYPDRATFKKVLQDWSVRKGYDLMFPKCEAKLITAKCKSGCDWYLRASTIQNSSTYQIKTLRGRHTCAYRTENCQADYRYLGSILLEHVRDNPDEPLDGLRKKLTRMGVQCSNYKLYRARKYALSLLSVDIGMQYNKLYDYCATVVKYNPGSSLVIKVNKEISPPKFKRMYVCMAALRKAFLSGCRPIIGLDGCFLKGLHKGQLLSAVGRDGNDNMIPIAIAYVEIEKQDSWKWFLELLLKDIGSPEENEWCWISDRQKGLIEALHELAPANEHRFCLKHMYNNFKVKFRSLELKKWFWKAASTYSVKQHQKIMKEIQRICPKRGTEETAFEWLCKVPTKYWARCFFSTRSKCDVLVNNISESFNNFVLPARDLAIIDMFEWIRKRCMTRIQVKKAGMERYPKLICSNTIKKIEAQREYNRNCFPGWAGDDKYEVEHNLENHIVYLKEGHCTCGRYQLCGYPCCHAMACISFHRLNVEDFVSDYFKKEKYVKMYENSIHPVPGVHDFEESRLGPIGPPDVKTKRGRPKKRRRPDGNDTGNQTKASRKGLTHTCGICKELGHNKRGCPKKPSQGNDENVVQPRGNEGPFQPTQDTVVGSTVDNPTRDRESN